VYLSDPEMHVNAGLPKDRYVNKYIVYCGSREGGKSEGVGLHLLPMGPQGGGV
jgi:hypothetical protein